MISYFSRIMLQRSPLLLVILCGIVLALVRWKRHPRISLFTLLGLLLYLFKLFSFTALFYSIPRIREAMNLSYGVANNLYSLLAVLNDLAFALIIVLLVVVAFAQRKPAVATG